jgi:hypothetical protein
MSHTFNYKENVVLKVMINKNPPNSPVLKSPKSVSSGVSVESPDLSKNNQKRSASRYI